MTDGDAVPTRGAAGLPRDPQGQAIYLLVQMAPGLTVSEELLGTQWPVGSESRWLLFPQLGVTDARFTRFAAELLAPQLGEAVAAMEERWGRMLAEDDPDDDSPHPVSWGRVTGGSAEPGRPQVVRAEVELAAAVCWYSGPEDPAARTEFLNEAGTAIDAWLAEMALWLDMLRGRLMPEASSPQAGAAGVVRGGAFIDDGDAYDGVGRFGLFREPPQYRTIRIVAGVNLDEWVAAVARVGTEPPLAHVLLRQARQAERHGDRRRAVIDATSACEVALSTWLQDHLAAIGSLRAQDVKGVMDRRERGGGVMDLYDFRIAVLGAVADVSPGRLGARLAGVRNRVAHGGAVPTDDEVRAALKVAGDLVAGVAPLPPWRTDVRPASHRTSPTS